jgi:uncharacterized repeat protein (TIGR03803 family)
MRCSGLPFFPRLFALVALAACSHNGAAFVPTPGGNPEAIQNSAQQYKVLHSFAGTPDGEHPAADLVVFKGNLYGTTVDGGTGCYKRLGCGTVFEVGPLGREERVIYRFRGGSDGTHPYSKLIAIGNTFYGTTRSGGGSGCGGGGCGTVFSVTPDGTERVLYTFKGGSDGSNPVAGLVALNGSLYGTTKFGGNPACPSRCGTVFAYDLAAKKEHVVYAFRGVPDGAQPVAPLIVVKGELYGSTEVGGDNASSACFYSSGCGTLFKVSPAGVESVLLVFILTPSDALAGFPTAPLTYSNGTFYGTSRVGGGGYTTGSGCGTVFSGTNGSWSVIYFFGSPYYSGCNQGTPNGVIVLDGVIYGTTAYGFGSVYKLQTSGAFTALHEFGGGSDGATPVASIINGPNGLLYGTTLNGGGKGCYNHAGCGTVFAVAP